MGLRALFALALPLAVSCIDPSYRSNLQGGGRRGRSIDFRAANARPNQGNFRHPRRDGVAPLGADTREPLDTSTLFSDVSRGSRSERRQEDSQQASDDGTMPSSAKRELQRARALKREARQSADLARRKLEFTQNAGRKAESAVKSARQRLRDLKSKGGKSKRRQGGGGEGRWINSPSPSSQLVDSGGKTRQDERNSRLKAAESILSTIRQQSASASMKASRLPGAAPTSALLPVSSVPSAGDVVRAIGTDGQPAADTKEVGEAELAMFKLTRALEELQEARSTQPSNETLIALRQSAYEQVKATAMQSVQGAEKLVGLAGEDSALAHAVNLSTVDAAAAAPAAPAAPDDHYWSTTTAPYDRATNLMAATNVTASVAVATAAVANATATLAAEAIAPKAVLPWESMVVVPGVSPDLGGSDARLDAIARLDAHGEVHALVHDADSEATAPHVPTKAKVVLSETEEARVAAAEARAAAAEARAKVAEAEARADAAEARAVAAAAAAAADAEARARATTTDVKAGVVLTATQFAEEADAKARAMAVAQFAAEASAANARAKSSAKGMALLALPKAYTSLLGTVVVDGSQPAADGPHGTAIVATHSMPATDLVHSDEQRAAEVQRMTAGIKAEMEHRAADELTPATAVQLHSDDAFAGEEAFAASAKAEIAAEEAKVSEAKQIAAAEAVPVPAAPSAPTAEVDEHSMAGEMAEEVKPASTSTEGTRMTIEAEEALAQKIITLTSNAAESLKLAVQTGRKDAKGLLVFEKIALRLLRKTYQSEIKPDLSKKQAAKTEMMLRRLSAADKNKTGSAAIDQAHKLTAKAVAQIDTLAGGDIARKLPSFKRAKNKLKEAFQHLQLAATKQELAMIAAAKRNPKRKWLQEQEQEAEAEVEVGPQEAKRRAEEEKSRVAWQAKWKRAKEEAGQGTVQQQEQELEEDEDEDGDEDEEEDENKAVGEHPDVAAARVESRLNDLDARLRAEAEVEAAAVQANTALQVRRLADEGNAQQPELVPEMAAAAEGISAAALRQRPEIAAAEDALASAVANSSDAEAWDPAAFWVKVDRKNEVRKAARQQARMDVAAEEQARASRAWNTTHYLPSEQDSTFAKAQLSGDFVGMLASARLAEEMHAARTAQAAALTREMGRKELARAEEANRAQAAATAEEQAAVATRAADVAMRQKAGDVELARTLAELAKQEKEKADNAARVEAKKEEERRAEQTQQRSIAEAARVFAMSQMQSQIKGQSKKEYLQRRQAMASSDGKAQAKALAAAQAAKDSQAAAKAATFALLLEDASSKEGEVAQGVAARAARDAQAAVRTAKEAAAAAQTAKRLQAAAHGAMEAAAAAQVTVKVQPSLALLAQPTEDKEELAKPAPFVLDEASSSSVAAEACQDLACFLRAAKQSNPMEVSFLQLAKSNLAAFLDSQQKDIRKEQRKDGDDIPRHSSLVAEADPVVHRAMGESTKPVVHRGMGEDDDDEAEHGNGKKKLKKKIKVLEIKKEARRRQVANEAHKSSAKKKIKKKIKADDKQMDADKRKDAAHEKKEEEEQEDGGDSEDDAEEDAEQSGDSDRVSARKAEHDKMLQQRQAGKDLMKSQKEARSQQKKEAKDADQKRKQQVKDEVNEELRKQQMKEGAEDEEEDEDEDEDEDGAAVSFLQFKFETGDDDGEKSLKAKSAGGAMKKLKKKLKAETKIADAHDRIDEMQDSKKKLKKKQKADEKREAAEKRKDDAERREDAEQEEDEGEDEQEDAEQESSDSEQLAVSEKSGASEQSAVSDASSDRVSARKAEKDNQLQQRQAQKDMQKSQAEARAQQKKDAKDADKLRKETLKASKEALKAAKESGAEASEDEGSRMAR